MLDIHLWEIHTFSQTGTQHLYFSILLLSFQVQGSRGNIMTGDLPQDFLRLGPPASQMAAQPGQVVGFPQMYYTNPAPFMPLQQPVGRLSITINQV